MRPAMAILRDIDAFVPENGDWRALDSLLGELWAVGVRQGQLATLFRVFERYPEEDGAGVLWSIVHGVEALSFDYESALRESLARQPSFMGRIMLRRLEKSRAV
jgi:hypothetical protein